MHLRVSVPPALVVAFMFIGKTDQLNTNVKTFNFFTNKINFCENPRLTLNGREKEKERE